MRKTDEEVLIEFLAVINTIPGKTSIAKESVGDIIWDSFLRMVQTAREEEPRINSGIHLYDYTMICDDDDNMDSFYGDYFNESAGNDD